MSARAVGLLLAAAAVVAIAGGLVWGSCDRQQDKPGTRADSVLATDTTWKRTVRHQDSVIAQLEDSIRVTDAARKQWRDSARAMTRRADHDQAAIDVTVAAGVPGGVEPATYYKDLFQAQARVATTLRLQVIPALERTILEDSIGLYQRDAKADSLTRQRNAARARVAQITKEFRTYREASRPGLDLGLFRVPEWVVDVGKVGLGVGIAVVIDQVVSEPKPVPRDADPVVSDLELSR